MNWSAIAGAVAATSLLTSTTTAFAQVQSQPETRAYLVLTGRHGRSITAIPMITLDQCEEQGALWIASDRKEIPKRGWTGFECLEGAK